MATNLKIRIYNLLLKSLYSLFRFLPLNDRLYFTSSPDFGESAWVFYKYLQKKKKYNFVWIVQDKSEYKDTYDTKYRNHGLIATSYYLATSKFIFATHGVEKVYKSRKNQKAILLWHGAPLKAGKDSSISNADYCVATGLGSVSTHARFLNVPKKIVLPLGYPRNDLLLNYVGPGYENPFSPRKDCKVIIWMPTYRKSSITNYSENQCDTETGLPLVSTVSLLESFNNFLYKTGVIVILKIHRLQAGKHIFSKSFSNLIFITDEDLATKGLQLYEVVGKSDALLSDYSSIIFDYLLTDKPQGFILDDIDLYKKDRGFLYENIIDYLPGHHIYNYDQLCGFVSDICNGVGRQQERRDELKSYFHANLHGEACENIAKYFNL